MDFQKELTTVEETAQKAIETRKNLVDQLTATEAEIVRLQGEYRAIKRMMDGEKKDEKTE